jgi:hypothetical protein
MLDTTLLEAKAAAVANGQRPHERLHVVAQLREVGFDHLHMHNLIPSRPVCRHNIESKSS